jgi:hypothetical protein
VIKLPRNDHAPASASTSLLKLAGQRLDFPEIAWPATQPAPVAQADPQSTVRANAPVPNAKPEPHLARPDIPLEVMQRRRAQTPSERKLHNASVRWMMALPRRFRPRLLALQFPHVVNRLAATWGDLVLAAGYFEELMVDRRGGRIGFPRAATVEILKLHELLLARQGSGYRPAYPEVSTSDDGGGNEWITTLQDAGIAADPASDPSA